MRSNNPADRSDSRGGGARSPLYVKVQPRHTRKSFPGSKKSSVRWSRSALTTERENRSSSSLLRPWSRLPASKRSVLPTILFTHISCLLELPLLLCPFGNKLHGLRLILYTAQHFLPLWSLIVFFPELYERNNPAISPAACVSLIISSALRAITTTTRHYKQQEWPTKTTATTTLSTTTMTTTSMLKTTMLSL